VPDIRSDLKKMLPHLLKAREDNLNEADTVQRIIKVCENVLGYDGLSEITSETKIKEKYVDLAIKLDGTVRLLVEAKAAAVPLKDKHIEQAQSYAAHANIPWVLLTNGVEWNLYHLSFEEGIEYVTAFSVDLSDDDIGAACDKLQYLHRQSLKKGDLDAFWDEQVALSPEPIAKALFCEASLKLIRRELKKSTGLLADLETLATALHNMFSVETRERIGPMRIRRGKAQRKPKPKEADTEQPATSEGPGDQ